MGAYAKMSYLKTGVVSHATKVRRLYKEACREIQSYYHFRHLIRYQCVLMRDRFDQNKDVIDMVHAKELLKIGEAELEKNRHPQPMKFPNSKGGVGFERDTISPDWLLDTWHPAERAQYPEYFKLREQRKKEFIELGKEIWKARTSSLDYCFFLLFCWADSVDCFVS